MQKANPTKVQPACITRSVRTAFLLFVLINAVVFTVHGIPYLNRPFNLRNQSTSLSSLRPYSPIFEPQNLIHRYKNDYTPDPSDPLDQNLVLIRDAERWRLLGGINETGDTMYLDRATGHFYSDEANVAFFLQISESNIILAPRLLSRVWHPDNVYAIHFDTKIPRHKRRRFVLALRSNPLLKNVLVLPSVPVTYRGVSELLNTLDSMHTLLTVSKSWDFYINLSGSDYPLISPVALRRLLAAPGLRESSRTFIEYSVQSIWDIGAKGRLGIVNFDPALSFRPDVREDLINSYKKHPGVTIPHDGEKGNLGIRIARGPAWIIAHRSFCDYAVHSNPARRVLTLFSTMSETSEHYFQTIAWNHHKFNETVVYSSMRDFAFTFRGVQSGQHPYYRDGKDGNGKWEMWPNLSHSYHFFARKFKKPNSHLLDHIDKQKSGATLGHANMTAVEESFALVKKRLACLLDFDRDLLINDIKPCSAKGRHMKGCNGNSEERCAGEFAEPPQ